MAIRCDEYNGVCVLSPEGDLSGDEATALRQALDDRIAAGGRLELVIDFEMCGYVDSAGLEVLLHAHRRLATSNGRISLANLDGNCRKVLEITRLARHFEISANLAGAMKN